MKRTDGKRPVQDQYKPFRDACEGCAWYRPLYTDKNEKACHYMYDTFQRRGCPPGKGCTKREEKKVEKHFGHISTLSKRKKPKKSAAVL